MKYLMLVIALVVCVSCKEKKKEKGGVAKRKGGDKS